MSTNPLSGIVEDLARLKSSVDEQKTALRPGVVVPGGVELTDGSVIQPEMSAGIDVGSRVLVAIQNRRAYMVGAGKGTGGSGSSKTLTQDIVVDPNGGGTHTTIEAALSDVGPGGRIILRQDPSSPITSYWPDGPIQLPNINGVTIEGWGKEVAGIAFPSGSSAGFYFDGTANPRNWVFRNLYIFSLGPLDGNTRGTVGRGIDLSGATTCVVEDVRLSGWLEGISGNGATQESHHMRFVNLRITNCGTGIKTTGTTVGTNNWQVIGGEISGNGVGIDTPGGAWRILGPSFESNGLALRYGGEGARIDMGRLEENDDDIELTSTARNNVIDAPMLDIWKYTDLSTNNTNLVNSNSRFSYGVSPQPLLQSIDLRVANGSITLDANVAYFVKFVADRVMKVDTITVIPTLTGGNIDAAIIDPLAGTDVISNTAGPRALGPNNTRQDLVLPTPVYLMPGREYRVAVVLDNASSTLFGQLPGTGFGQVVANGMLFTVTIKSSMYPLAGKTWSGLDAAWMTPWIWIH